MKVLCIDGGGIRGLIPALVLAEIERRTGRRTAELVDLVAGTSTGGILACAPHPPRRRRRARCSAPRSSPGIYVEEGPRIFHRGLLKRVFSAGGWIDERYEDDGLERALDALPRRRAGCPRRSCTSSSPRTTSTTASRSSSAPRAPCATRPTTSRSPRVARATSAAPTYFEPEEVTDRAGARTYPLIDGGVYAVNPSMCAYADVVARRPRPATCG